jgi:hypothetical protein
MDRRKALKNMGMTIGYAVSAPSLISILQSCKDSSPDWTPEFFTPEQGAGLRKLVDIIIPKTDTPSASEVNLHVFIDKFMNEVAEPREQEFLKASMGKFFDKALADSGEDEIGDLEAEHLEPVLAAGLNMSKEDQAKMYESITSYQEANEKGEEADLDDEAFRFSFANNLRGIVIWGYKTSEHVGEQVLAYLPVPGEYIGCGDLQELTGGKAWSI